jgi:predicted O-methyltransferase YrrM
MKHTHRLKPSYLFAKYSDFRFRRKYPDAPWITATAVQILDSWLKESDTGVEFGSGRSTIWFAQRVSHLLSVENNREWYERINSELIRLGISTKVTYRFCETSNGDNAYSEQVNDVANESIDFALVDGRKRKECMESAMPKLKKGGMLILDNAERFVPNKLRGGYSTVHTHRNQWADGWEYIREELDSWRKIVTVDGIRDTRIWIKPY